MRAPLARDFERFRRSLPRDFPAHVRETYRIDLTAHYLGERLPHPVGKGSGQLSLNAKQLEEDAEAGLAFAILKTVIAQDEAGAQSMAAWAIHETKMKVERRRATTGAEGWTVTWKGRGWDRSFDEYLGLVRTGRDLTRADLRFIIRRGLQETAGSYKLLVELLNMKPTDYKRFLNFLRKHECQVPFERFRSARARTTPLPPDEDTDAPIVDRTPPVFDDVGAMSDRVSDIPTARH